MSRWVEKVVLSKGHLRTIGRGLVKSPLYQRAVSNGELWSTSSEW